jgi:RNA polymerase sigma-70 factor, ECF subfamily
MQRSGSTSCSALRVAVLSASWITPEAIVIERSNQALVQDAIAELPVKFREILLLCEMEEMTYQEIAATLSVPVGTVMSRLARARAALREVLRQKLRKS